MPWFLVFDLRKRNLPFLFSYVTMENELNTMEEGSWVHDTLTFEGFSES